MRHILLTAIAFIVFAVPSQSKDSESGQQAFESGDYVTALAEWEPLANQGDPVAQFGMGILHLDGNVVPKDYDAASDWFLQAAQQGLFEAQALVFSNIPEGYGPPLEMVIEWLEPVAKAGNTFAQFELAYIYHLGNRVPPDLEKAVMWYQKSAAGGVVGAQNNLANMYFNGEGIAQDFSQAFYWIKKAAEQGKAIPQLNLSGAYADGIGTLQDLKSAMVWALVAKENGHPDAEQWVQEFSIYLSFFERLEVGRRVRACLDTEYRDCD